MERQRYPFTGLADGAHTFEDLSIDNLDRICIANEVEEHFHVELSDDAVAAWDSVADVMLSVEQARA